MALPKSLTAALVAYVTRLRFPTLFVLCALVFVADLIVPDAIPLVDEILLGLVTAGLAAWRDERASRRESPPMKDVTPRGGSGEGAGPSEGSG